MESFEESETGLLDMVNLDPKYGMIYNAGILRAWKQMIVSELILPNFISSLRKELKILIFKVSAIRTCKAHN